LMWLRQTRGSIAMLAAALVAPHRTYFASLDVAALSH